VIKGLVKKARKKKTLKKTDLRLQKQAFESPRYKSKVVVYLLKVPKKFLKTY
jgi:hypothetical protein